MGRSDEHHKMLDPPRTEMRDVITSRVNPNRGSDRPPDDAGLTLRVQPKQERARIQLELILSSAASIADEVGPEHLSTAEVAKRAGCSVGTIYRLFPDKYHLFSHLASRNINLILGRIAGSGRSLASPASTAVEILLLTQQTTPGYRYIRVGADYQDVKRDGWSEIADAVISAAPKSHSCHATVAAALRGVDGILASDIDDETMMWLATSLLEKALTSQHQASGAADV
jgi:AcrR family transcriptional regulator